MIRLYEILINDMPFSAFFFVMIRTFELTLHSLDVVAFAIQ